MPNNISGSNRGNYSAEISPKKPDIPSGCKNLSLAMELGGRQRTILDAVEQYIYEFNQKLSAGAKKLDIRDFKDIKYSPGRPSPHGKKPKKLRIKGTWSIKLNYNGWEQTLKGKQLAYTSIGAGKNKERSRQLALTAAKSLASVQRQAFYFKQDPQYEAVYREKNGKTHVVSHNALKHAHQVRSIRIKLLGEGKRQIEFSSGNKVFQITKDYSKLGKKRLRKSIDNVTKGVRSKFLALMGMPRPNSNSIKNEVDEVQNQAENLASEESSSDLIRKRKRQAPPQLPDRNVKQNPAHGPYSDLKSRPLPEAPISKLSRPLPATPPDPKRVEEMVKDEVQNQEKSLASEESSSDLIRKRKRQAHPQLPDRNVKQNPAHGPYGNLKSRPLPEAPISKVSRPLPAPPPEPKRVEELVKNEKAFYQSMEELAELIKSIKAGKLKIRSDKEKFDKDRVENWKSEWLTQLERIQVFSRKAQKLYLKGNPSVKEIHDLYTSATGKNYFSALKRLAFAYPEKATFKISKGAKRSIPDPIRGDLKKAESAKRMFTQKFQAMLSQPFQRVDRLRMLFDAMGNPQKVQISNELEKLQRFAKEEANKLDKQCLALKEHCKSIDLPTVSDLIHEAEKMSPKDGKKAISEIKNAFD